MTDMTNTQTEALELHGSRTTMAMPKSTRVESGPRQSKYRDELAALRVDTDDAYVINTGSQDPEVAKKAKNRLASAVSQYRALVKPEHSFAIRQGEDEAGNILVGVWAVSKTRKSKKADVAEDQAAE